MITIPTPPRVIAGRFRGVKHKNLRLLSTVGPAHTSIMYVDRHILEEARHRSLVERRNHRVDLGADLDAVHEARGQLRSERRRAGLGT